MSHPLLEEWKDHATFGGEFNRWLAKFLEKYEVCDPEEEERKKRSLSGGGQGSPAKKPRVSKGIVLASSITAAVLHQAPLGKNLPSLHIRVGPAIYLVATQTEGEAVLGTHHAIAGFGAGSFKNLKAGEDSHPCHFLLSQLLLPCQLAHVVLDPQAIHSHPPSVPRVM